MRLEYMFAGIVLAFLLLVGLFTIYSGMKNSYSPEANTFSKDTGVIGNYSEKLGLLLGTSSQADALLDNSNPDASQDASTLIPGYGVYSKFKESKSALGNLTQEVAVKTGFIQPIVVNSLLAILTAIVVFLVVYLVFRNILVR